MTNAWREAVQIQSLQRYETRRTSILESKESIEGIFFVYNNQIIPDYYSECLESDSVGFNCFRNDGSPQREMYLKRFFENYLVQKYPELKGRCTEASLPRGRTSVLSTRKILKIDRCLLENESIMKEIKSLYRLPDDIDIELVYTCSRCSGEQL